MVLDDLDNASLYHPLGAKFKQALDFLCRVDPEGLLPGSHPIEGEAVFAGVDDYQTKAHSDGFWEAHRRHIDIQAVLHGEELIGVARTASMTGEPYDAEKDFQKLYGRGDQILMRPGQFAIFFPQDAHMPGLAVGQPSSVRKLVIKIRID